MLLAKYTQQISLFLVSLFVIGSVAGVGILQPTTAYAQAPRDTTRIEPKDDDCKRKPLTKNNCGIVRLIVTITNIMGAIAGIVIVGTLIYGGILYSTAGADPSRIQAAKGKITSGLTALLLFVFGFAVLQWMVPGGVL